MIIRIYQLHHFSILNVPFLPKLKYCAVVWDPYFATEKSSLENVHYTPGRGKFVPRNVIN